MENENHAVNILRAKAVADVLKCNINDITRKTSYKKSSLKEKKS